MLNKALMGVSGPVDEGWVLLENEIGRAGYRSSSSSKQEEIYPPSTKSKLLWTYQDSSHKNELTQVQFSYTGKSPSDFPVPVELKQVFSVISASGTTLMQIEEILRWGTQILATSSKAYVQYVKAPGIPTHYASFFTPNNLAYIRSSSFNSAQVKVEIFYRPMSAEP